MQDVKSIYSLLEFHMLTQRDLLSEELDIDFFRCSPNRVHFIDEVRQTLME